MRALSIVALVAALFAVSAPTLEAQCAMCRTALERSAEGQAVAEKLNKGILVLLGAPVSVAALIGVAMVRSRRRLDRM